MRKARLIPMSVGVICPDCEESVAEPRTGSLFWTLTEIGRDPVAVDCDNCGMRFSLSLPKSIKTVEVA